MIHEHQRPDRDGYISVQQSGWRGEACSDPDFNEYEKVGADEIDSYTDYDMCSIMHYGDSATVDRECSWYYFQRRSCSWNTRCNYFAKKKQPCFIKGKLTDDIYACNSF